MSLYRLSEHDINSNFSNFVRKINQEIIWNFCVIRLLHSVSAHNLIIHFIWFKELSYVDCQNGAQYTIKASQYILRINPLGVVEIIGFRNDAIHEPLPGHQLNFLWQNVVSDLYIFDHQRVNISLGSMLERFHTTINGGSLWDLKLCEMRVTVLPSSFISQVVIMDIIYKHCKLRKEHFSHSPG